jgi:group I intron endonuclease
MIIYKVTCLVTNKVYIGKTIKTLAQRKSVHLSHAKKYNDTSAFHSAIRKYGKDNFIWEVLDRVMFSDLLIDLECFYISKYNCMSPNGYNLTVGGEGATGYRHTEEAKKKIGLAGVGKKNTLGYHHSQEAKEKISVAGMGRKKSDETRKKLSVANTGKRLSEETRNKISKVQIGKFVSLETRKKMSDSNIGKPWTQARRDAENARCGMVVQ